MRETFTLFLILTFILTAHYTLKLNSQKKSSLPFIESAEFLSSIGSEYGVFTMHPEILSKYYNGTIFELPKKGGYEHILKEVIMKGIKYLIIESAYVCD